MSATLATAALSLLILGLMFIPLEWAFPARAGQRLWRPSLHVDACFFLGQYLLFAHLAGSAIDFTHAHLVAYIPPALRQWSEARHPVVLVLVAVAAGDFVVYWLHRAFHGVSWLWRFHAVHHTPEQLDWMAAFREHPLDGISTQLTINIPAIILGVRPDLYAVAAVFRGAWAIFVHSNVRLPLGPLRLLFGAPELHRWHHASVERTRHNFANLAPWLDLIFGTYHRPREESYRLGLTTPSPRGYLALLLRPLNPLRYFG